MAAETYDDLIFKLGDLAREHLAESKDAPRAMEAVFDMEDAVLEARDALKALEDQLNQEDEDYAAFQERSAVEMKEQQKIIAKWSTAVAGVEKRTRDLKKKLASQKAAHRYQGKSLKLAEEKHKELEMREGHDVQKINASRENLKKLRMAHMRDKRHIDDLEFEFNSVLTPRPGQPGAQGILAHKRLLELEDEAEQRKLDHDDTMKHLEQSLVDQDENIKEAEKDLDDAIFGLGEETYGERIPHAALKSLYAKLDKAK